MRKLALLFICMFFASMARAQTGTIVLTVTSTPTAIVVNQNCNYVVVQENTATPSFAFTITLPGQATGITYAAGTKFIFSASTNGYVNGQTLGTISVASSTANFIGIESVVTPTIPVKAPSSGGGGSGPALQTNGTPNGSQSLLNLANGPNISITDNGSGTDTISASGIGAAGVTGNVQYNNAGSFAGAAGITTEDGNNLRIKGLDPFVDATAMGAKSYPFNSNPSTTGSCSGGTTITLASNPIIPGYGIFNGDGITVYGCGSTNTMSTPSAPTVAPATMAGETGTGWTVAIPAAGVGATTYSYKVVARDLFGGLTAASAATTTTTGQATLGVATNNISTITRSNDTLTVVTTAANLVNTGTLVHIIVAAGNQMDGWYIVSSVTNSTTFVINDTAVDTRVQGWSVGDTYAQSTGSIAYWVSNHLHLSVVSGAWEYYIYGKRPGDSTYNLIGVTKPQGISVGVTAGNGYQDLDWDDYGATVMANQSFPSYVPATAPSSATNDMYTGIVTAGGGTTTLTVSPATSQTISGQFATYDAAPNILAAAVAANYQTNTGNILSYVYLPGSSAYTGTSGGTYYQTFSPLIFPPKTSIVLAGALLANETVTMQGAGSIWDCKLAAGFGAPQFGWGGGANIWELNNEPLLHLVGQGNEMDHCVILNRASNGGTEVVTDNASSANFNYVNFSSGAAATDYLSMNVVARETTQTISTINFDHVEFDGGPDQVTDKSWTPLLWLPPGQNGSGGGGNEAIYLTIKNAKVNRRGFYISNNNISNGPGYTDIDWVYRQGGLTPMMAIQSAVSNELLRMHNISLDTEGNPVVAYLNNGANGGLLDLSLVSGGDSEPIISGTRSSSARIYEFGSTGSAYQNQLQYRDSSHEGSAFLTASPFFNGSSTPQQIGLWTFFEPVHIPGGQSLYFDMAAPTNVAGSVAAGGSVPVASAIYYAVSAIGSDSGETIPSLPSSSVTTSSGNQTVNLTWTAATGAVSYNVWRCTVGSDCISTQGVININAHSGGNSAWNRVAFHNAPTSFSDTAASGTISQPPFVTGTGVTTLNSSGLTLQNLTVNGICTGCSGGSGLSGMTATQVPIAATATTVTSSKAIQGTDTKLLSSGTISGTGAALCSSANGGATTTGCTGANGLSGMTATQIPVAATATTVTSSIATTGSGNVVLATTPTLVTPVIGAATGTSLNLGATAVLSTTAQSGTGSLCMTTNCTMVTPTIGAATGTSLLVTGNLDGTAPVTATTGTTATIGAGSFKSGYTFNQEATAGAGVTYTLPATVKGMQFCVKNSIVSGTGAPDTGVLTVYPAASSYVILNGVINTIGGGGTHGVVSTGAAADAACFVAVDATHWDVWALSGSWSLN